MTIETDRTHPRGSSSNRLSSRISAIERIYRLVAPSGRGKLTKAFSISLCQSLVQVIGVASIGPFIAAATSPDALRGVFAGLGPLATLASLDDRSLLIGFGIALVALNVFCCVVNIAADRSRASYSQQVGLDLRNRILVALVATPYDQFARRNSSVILNNLQVNTERFSGLVLLPVMELFSRVLLVIFLLLLMLTVSPFLTLLAASGILAGYALTYRILAPRRAALSSLMGITGRETMGAAQELLFGYKVVLTSNAEPYFAGRYRANAVKRAECLARIPILQRAPKYLMETVALATMVTLSLVSIGSGQSVESLLPTLGFLAFAAYRILPALQFIYFSATCLSTNWHTVEELELELWQDRMLSGSGPKSEGEHVKANTCSLGLKRDIKVDRLCYRYPNSDVDTLRNVSLVIKKNSCLGICGPSGAGKSTFVDVILGLLPPTRGKILVDGVPLGSGNVQSWREIVAYVPQEIFLIDDTLERNIAFGVSIEDVDHKRVRQVCITAQLDSWVSGLPEGLQTQVGDRGVRLSGGQRQRVALARALYRQPDVLILDEATSALDQQTEAAFMECLERLHGQLTMIMIAHRLSTLEICDRVVYVSDGEVQERKLESVHPTT